MCIYTAYCLVFAIFCLCYSLLWMWLCNKKGQPGNRFLTEIKKNPHWPNIDLWPYVYYAQLITYSWLFKLGHIAINMHHPLWIFITTTQPLTSHPLRHVASKRTQPLTYMHEVQTQSTHFTRQSTHSTAQSTHSWRNRRISRRNWRILRRNRCISWRN